jgi:hypothetical protein
MTPSSTWLRSRSNRAVSVADPNEETGWMTIPARSLRSILECHQATTIGDGWQGQGVLRGAVDQAQHTEWELLSDLVRNVVAGFDDDISAETTNERRIGRGRDRQHRQAVRLGELGSVSPHCSACTYDCDHAAWREGQRVQGEACRDRVEQKRRRLREASPERCSDH